MKIVNKSSSKVIFVNHHMLLPDDSMVADESMVNDSVKLLVDKGLLFIDYSDEKKAEPVTPKQANPVAPVVEEVSETVSEDEAEAAPVTRRGRRAKNAEETPAE